MKSIHNNQLTTRQMTLMIVLFMFGSSVVIGVSPQNRQDSWISLLTAAVLCIPVFLLYARIIHLMKGQDFFTSILDWFGTIAGKIIIGFFVWYCLHMAGIVTRNLSEFMEIAAMPETPQLPLMTSVLLVSTYLCKSRIQVIGRWSVIGFYITSAIIIITILATVSHMNFYYLFPIMEHSPAEIFDSAFKISAFPYAECVAFLPLMSAVKNSNPYKTFLKGHFWSTVLLMIILLRNIFCIGPHLMVAEYFPSFTCAKIMEIGDFLSRIEGTISINLIIAGLTKTTIFLYSGSLGLAKLINIPNKMDLITMPVCLFALTLCMISYTDALQMFGFLDFYAYYAFPFQIIIPVIIWLMGEWKTRKKHTSPAPTAA